MATAIYPLYKQALLDGGSDIDLNGLMRWGPGGSTAPDTDLYRSGVGALATDGAFKAAFEEGSP